MVTKNGLQPLQSDQKIVNPDGTPTLAFIRWAQQRQEDIGAGQTAAQVGTAIDDWAQDRQIDAGRGLTGGGPLSADVKIALDPSVSISGFGTIDYTDADAPNPLALPANAWVNVSRNLQPAAQNFNLPKGPWTNFAFYAGGLFRAQKVGDLYLFKFAYKVTPTLANATMRFGLQPVGQPQFDFGPGPISLTVAAGEQEEGSITFFEQARRGFVTNGAQALIMLSCAGTLDEFSPEIAPLSYAD